SWATASKFRTDPGGVFRRTDFQSVHSPGRIENPSYGTRHTPARSALTLLRQRSARDSARCGRVMLKFRPVRRIAAPHRFRALLWLLPLSVSETIPATLPRLCA